MTSPDIISRAEELTGRIVHLHVDTAYMEDIWDELEALLSSSPSSQRTMRIQDWTISDLIYQAMKKRAEHEIRTR